MRISVFSWFIAVLLAAFVLLIVVAAYQGRNETGCTPSCWGTGVLLLLVTLGLFGASLSASVGQLGKSRDESLKRAIRAGGVIYLVASIVFSVFFIASVAAPVMFIFSLIIATMIFTGGQKRSH